MIACRGGGRRRKCRNQLLRIITKMEVTRITGKHHVRKTTIRHQDGRKCIRCLQEKNSVTNVNQNNP